MHESTSPSLRRRITAVLSAFVVMVAFGCGPAQTQRHASATSASNPNTSSTLPPISAYAQRGLPDREPWLSLVGRPEFDPEALTSDQRRWYDRLRSAVDTSQDVMLARVERDNSYDLGRWLFQYHHALLLGLRSTGDLGFLDDLDVTAQAIRGLLRDAWCGGVSDSLDVNIRYGTVRSPDGHVNFRFRESRGRDYCRDTADLDEALVHGNLAMIMYAYHANRHLQSPSGIDYGERADFWLSYLREHFEPKWRGRSGVEWPSMDFIETKFCHTYHQMLLFHYFVGKRLLDDGSSDAGPYLRQAMRMTDGMFEVAYIPGERPGGFIEVDTPLGDAVIYSFGAPGATDVSPTHLEACPMTYARYMLTSVLTLRLEAFGEWDDEIMRRLATGIAHFLLDTDDVTGSDEPFAAGVTGSDSIAGMPPTEYRSRNSLMDFILTPFAAYGVWDESGRIDEVTNEVYAAAESDPEHPEYVFVPASMLFAATIAARGE